MNFIIYKKLKRSNRRLKEIEEKVNKMSAVLDALAMEIADTNAIMQSAIVLINGLAAKLAEIAEDPAQIMALTAELDAKSDELLAVVQANTPPVP